MPDCRNRLLRLNPSMLAAILMAALICPVTAQAEGFPGKGSRLEWGYALPYYNLANRYLNQGRFEQAIDKYKEAIGKYPYDPDFFSNLGIALIKKGDLEGAEEAYLRAIELDDKDWSLWSNLATVYLKRDMLPACIDAFEKAAKRNPPPEQKAAIENDLVQLKKFLAMQKEASQ